MFWGTNNFGADWGETDIYVSLTKVRSTKYPKGFLTKINPDNTYAWTKVFSWEGKELAITTNGYVYLLGWTRMGSRYILKMDSADNVIYTKYLPGLNYVGINIDHNDTIPFSISINVINILTLHLLSRIITSIQGGRP